MGCATTAALLVFLYLASAPAGAARSDNLVLYFQKSSSVIPLSMIDRVPYFQLLQVLNVSGRVNGLQEQRNSAKIWFGNTQIEVHNNENGVRLNKVKLLLSQPIRFYKGEWQAPVEFLSAVLPTLLNQNVTYDPRGFRVFVGDVEPNTFSVRVNPLPEGAQLQLQFAQPITMRTASSNGRWIIYPGGHPIEPLEPSYHFDNAYITELMFDDQDGVPKLVVTPTSNGLNFYPGLSDGGKLLLAEITKPGAPRVTSAPTVAPPAVQPPAAAPPSSQPNQQLPQPPSALAPSQPAGPVIVLDAGHGGVDPGARGPNGLLEKDLVAALVARVRAAILNGQNARVILTRPGDTDPSFEERAATANVARPIAYISFHAGELGATSPRVLVYTYQPTAPLPIPSPNDLFIPWQSAQELFLDRSQRLAGAITNELGKSPVLSTGPPMAVPARALRSIAAPAVAVEIGSLDPDTDAALLTNPDIQQQIASAVARAVAAFAKTGDQP